MFFKKAKTARDERAAEIAQARGSARELVEAMKKKPALRSVPMPARELEDELDGTTSEPTLPPTVVQTPKPR